MVHGVTWSVKLNEQAGYRMRYRIDSDYRQREGGWGLDWKGHRRANWKCPAGS